MADSGIRIPKTAEDWNALWKAKQSLRVANKDAQSWDGRAATFDKNDEDDAYTREFLHLAAVLDGESVFDMGCGTGNLAVSLGASGHTVLAADFSEGMLGRLREKLVAQRIETVDVRKLSWSDDWSTAGIDDHSRDVCFASRSLITDDLMDSLLKLTRIAKRRICITVATGVNPRIDERILPILGIEGEPCMDDVYTLAILSALGYLPEIRYIHTSRRNIFADFDDALEKHMRMALIAKGSDAQGISNSELTDIRRRLTRWLEDNLVPYHDPAASKAEDTEGSTRMRLATPRATTWAFISWAK